MSQKIIAIRENTSLYVIKGNRKNWLKEKKTIEKRINKTYIH